MIIYRRDKILLLTLSSTSMKVFCIFVSILIPIHFSTLPPFHIFLSYNALILQSNFLIVALSDWPFLLCMYFNHALSLLFLYEYHISLWLAILLNLFRIAVIWIEKCVPIESWICIFPCTFNNLFPIDLLNPHSFKPR